LNEKCEKVSVSGLKERLHTTIKPSMPALPHRLDLPFSTCCQPQCTVWWSWMCF